MTQFTVNILNDITTDRGKEYAFFQPIYGHLTINGYGHKIKHRTYEPISDTNSVFKKFNDNFAIVNSNCVLIVNNLTIEDFILPIINYGTTLIYNNVTFFNNTIHNIIDSGDAPYCVKNLGILKCSNCTFKKNEAILSIIYCTKQAITIIN